MRSGFWAYASAGWGVLPLPHRWQDRSPKLGPRPAGSASRPALHARGALPCGDPTRDRLRDSGLTPGGARPTRFGPGPERLPAHPTSLAPTTRHDLASVRGWGIVTGVEGTGISLAVVLRDQWLGGGSISR